MNNGNEIEKSPQPSNRRLFAVARMVLLFLLVIALLYWLFGWMKESILYVHETDARVMADLITISSEVEGKIVKRFVSEGTNVRKGDPLIQINSRLIDLKIKYKDGSSGPVREIQSGSGYWSQNSPVQIMGYNKPVSSIKIQWPDGSNSSESFNEEKVIIKYTGD